MDKAAGDPLVGTTVAHYHVEAKLGGGGMGIVYAARDTKLGRRVALKFLPPQWSHDESAKQRFIREAQAASATDHPNICTIHDISTAGDGQLFIVMAHYDGQTLKQRLEAGPLPVDEAVDIAAQVAEGLAKAHAHGVVHRDIKPGNLMLTEDGVRILDFGLAKFADARLKLTLEGSTLGTIAYMSPEQARGEEADARSDVWSAGVVLYEMLTGHMPFKGGYPEAIAHAIKNDPPVPIRTSVPEVSEGLEQLVFRALHKEPGVRFQTARDLARALRILQGRTIPLDLRTEPLPALDAARAGRESRRWWKSRKAAAVAAALAAVIVGTLWLFSPVERMPVAVAPVVNQTGFAELDPYRLALTNELVAQLAESRSIRVLPYDRLLQIVRRFRAAGQDVSSREAMQALTTQSGARVIIVPTLLNEDGGWKARVEFRNPGTATTETTWETPVVVSSLAKDAVYGLIATLTAGIQEHFTQTGPLKAYIADRVLRMAGWTASPDAPRLRTLDAAAVFEQGLDAYEQQEYPAAVRAFTMASEQDPRNPVVLAWHSRVARILRRDDEAAEAAEGAMRLLPAGTSAADRLFVEAIAAETRRDADTAEARYVALVAQSPGDAHPILQRAAFLERQGRSADAIAAHHEALAADSRLVRPHADLCRLYNPRELANAKAHGTRALEGYRALGDRGGEAQALFCLVDILRQGGVEERQEARRQAQAALGILEALQYPYNVSRARNYVALAAYAQGDLPGAAAAWEQSLGSARASGNVVLEPLVLMNLGAVHSRLGQRGRQLDYFQQSSALFEALGQQQRAAELEANVGALLIEYGGKPDEGLRRLQNALTVSRKLGNTTFELFAARVTAWYDLFAGRLGDAERGLNRALALAKERDNQDYVRSLTVDLARSRFDAGDYGAANNLLAQALGDGSTPVATSTRILQAQTHGRLGDFDAALHELDQAARELQAGGDPEFQPMLHAVSGELAYEMGQPVIARAAFTRAAAFWTDDLPDAASVEARAYLGLLDALEGRVAQGRAALRASLDQARKMGRLSLETRCRLYLARIEIAAQQYAAALKTLDEIPPDDGSRTVGAELRALTLYWRSRALAALGNPAASTDADRARRMIADVLARIPEASRARFASRPDIRLILG